PLTLVETGPNSQLLVMLTEVLGQIEVSDDFQKTKYAAALKLVEYLGQADAMESERRRLARAAAPGLMGRRSDTYEQIDAALEAFVREAGPEHDQPLLRLFMAQIERRVQVYGSTAIGASASHIDLPAIEPR